ncbi:MAG TPA: hypothetical protein VN892_06415, partial [Solirubrobacteraceae bacterium]|nr:hypothetical protein [Solirubrobacteraceae bacterium]
MTLPEIARRAGMDGLTSGRSPIVVQARRKGSGDANPPARGSSSRRAARARAAHRHDGEASASGAHTPV